MIYMYIFISILICGFVLTYGSPKFCGLSLFSPVVYTFIYIYMYLGFTTFSEKPKSIFLHICINIHMYDYGISPGALPTSQNLSSSVSNRH